MGRLLQGIYRVVWGPPGLLAILGAGLYLSLRLRFIQVRLFPQALRCFFRRLFDSRHSGGGVSSFEALCTALAATVGTGNLVGVAGAVCLGGPGAVFWMVLCAVLGMATKFSEVCLAIRYRVKVGEEMAGGPMYVIRQGLGKRFRPLAMVYCLFGMVAAFGVGNAAQINACVCGTEEILAFFGRPMGQLGKLAVGLLIGVFVGAVLWGGAKKTGKAAVFLVPFAVAAYLLLCIAVLVLRRQAIPGAVTAIFQGAFAPRAVTGGMLGSAYQALRVGCSRGVFTNEAGMGTASIAHASAQVERPVEQGLMGVMEVFLDTVVMCTLTALVILVSGVPIPYGEDAGGILTTLAFREVFGPWAGVGLGMILVLLAVATVLGWGLYGIRCAQFLLGPGFGKWFLLSQVVWAAASAVLDTATVWQLSETVNVLMAFPNLIALVLLSGEVASLAKETPPAFRRKPGEEAQSAFTVGS